MTLLDQLAEFVAGVSFENLPAATVEQARLHVFDTIAATLTGAKTEEAGANLQLIKKVIPALQSPGISVPGFGFSAPLPSALLLSCIATRLTEMDDIDIASCTTPGSVVVPASLTLASASASSERTFMEGVVVGYEVMTRLAAALNGAEIIYRGIWPTYLCAAICVAATGSKILDLTKEQTSNALAVSLSMSTGLAGKFKGRLTSRWLMLGCAAQSGLLAAFAAGDDFSGDGSILDSSFSSTYGLELNRDLLLSRLGREFQIEKVNLKPYCSARQAVASIEAFTYLLKTHSIKPEEIDELEVTVPKQYSEMIGKEGFPEDRLASITSVRYQLALAAFYEDDLFDTERKKLRKKERVSAFIEKVRVIPSSQFTELYPHQWPGKISVITGGQKYEHEVLSPKGDADRWMGWEDVERKWKLAAGRTVGPGKIDELRTRVKELGRNGKLDDLLRACT